MKIYISADIEGVAGVVSQQQVTQGNPEYERARRLMTAEVNAAIEGALEAGATEILVNDSHGPMVNLLPDELHPAAELILGRPKPIGMFAGLEPDAAGVMCVGFHTSARQYGILAHTTNSFAFGRVRVQEVVDKGVTFGVQLLGRLCIGQLLSSSLLLASALGASADSRAAMSRACAKAWPLSVTRLTRPWVCSCRAVTGSLSQIISVASWRGSVCISCQVAPPSGETPMRL